MVKAKTTDLKISVKRFLMIFLHTPRWVHYPIFIRKTLAADGNGWRAPRGKYLWINEVTHTWANRDRSSKHGAYRVLAINLLFLWNLWLWGNVILLTLVPALGTLFLPLDCCVQLWYDSFPFNYILFCHVWLSALRSLFFSNERRKVNME
jgi:hypothetical protein